MEDKELNKINNLIKNGQNLNKYASKEDKQMASKHQDAQHQ